VKWHGIGHKRPHSRLFDPEAVDYGPSVTGDRGKLRLNDSFALCALSIFHLGKRLRGFSSENCNGGIEKLGNRFRLARGRREIDAVADIDDAINLMVRKESSWPVRGQRKGKGTTRMDTEWSDHQETCFGHSFERL
jgi:hypothetical protein